MLGLIGVKRVPSLSGLLRKSRSDEDKKFQEAVQAVRRQASAPRRTSRPLSPDTIATPNTSATIERGAISWIAGPAYVESVAQTIAAAAMVAEAGGTYLRARAYWPEAQEEDFQRHLEAGLKVLRAAGRHFNLAVVSEVLRIEDVPLVAEYCDVLEIEPYCSTDMALLEAVRNTGKSMIVHRHPMVRIERFFSMLEQLRSDTLPPIVIAESAGSVAHETSLDISTLLTLRRLGDYPVLIHCALDQTEQGFVEDLAAAAIAAGADGVIAELAFDDHALSGAQLQGMMQRTRALKHTLNALVHHRCQGI